jgi:hypothetical protein
MHNAFDHTCLHPVVTVFSELAYVVETVSKDLSDHTMMGTMRPPEPKRIKIGKGMRKPGVRSVGIRDFLQQGKFVRSLLCARKRLGSFAGENLERNEPIFSEISLRDAGRLETA